MPRAKLFAADGKEEEWQSAIIPRYARRCRAVDAALLGMYFGGVNTRKVKQAISPLLRNSPLSKSSISRLIVRLKDYFEGWRKRSLAGEDVRYIYLDGICVRVRCGGRTESLPVLAAVGVRADGEKVLLALELCGAESTSSWKGLIESMSARGLRAPKLAIVDGNPGLAQALALTWPKTDRQRCAVHKLRNLHDHAPKRLYDGSATTSIPSSTPRTTPRARGVRSFPQKWRRSCEGVTRSLEKPGWSC